RSHPQLSTSLTQLSPLCSSPTPCCRAPGAATDAHSQGRGQCQGIPPAPEGGHPGTHGPAGAQPRPYGAPGCPSRQGIAAERERRKTSIWQEGSCLTS
uniref:Uncharacterized protein n=1 Tax=Accipiter nisus TaxID=211598 RepID=A0A8B9M7R6_9AVES